MVAAEALTLRPDRSVPETTAVTAPPDPGPQLVEMVPDQLAEADGPAVHRMARPDWPQPVQGAVEPRRLTPAGTVSERETPPTTCCPETVTCTNGDCADPAIARPTDKEPGGGVDGVCVTRGVTGGTTTEGAGPGVEGTGLGREGRTSGRVVGVVLAELPEGVGVWLVADALTAGLMFAFAGLAVSRGQIAQTATAVLTVATVATVTQLPAPKVLAEPPAAPPEAVPAPLEAAAPLVAPAPVEAVTSAAPAPP